MRLIMTLVVRDERDIIEANLRYHFAQGVDSVIVTDNGSTDGTLDVLGQYAAAGLLHLIEEHSDDYHERQADWITHMARLAATELDADWVINNDADEFWWPVSGTLRDAFDNIPERYQALAATRPEFIPRPDGPGTFADRMVIRESRSHTTPKLAHRGIPDVNVFIGSHRLTRGPGGPGSDGIGRRAVRPVLRPVGAEPEDRDLLVPAPVWPIRILHFPLRSYGQYEARVRRIALQERADLDGRRRQLHDEYVAGRLPKVYAELVRQDRLEAGLAAGRLVRDTGLRDYLHACPDPLAIGGRAAAMPVRSLAAHERDAELAAIEEDMMRALVRNEHTLLGQRARARRRLRECRQQLDQLRRGRHQAREADDDRPPAQGAGERTVWMRLRNAAGRMRPSARLRA